MVASKPDGLDKSHPSILRKDESMLNDLRSLEEKLECYFKISCYLPCVCVCQYHPLHLWVQSRLRVLSNVTIKAQIFGVADGAGGAKGTLHPMLDMYSVESRDFCATRYVDAVNL